MKDIALFFLPSGIILSIFLLSGVAMLQSIAMSLQRKKIIFHLYSHKINIPISSIISLYALIRLAHTVFELNSYNDKKYNFENVNSLNLNRSYLKKMRLQRNFWILLLCSITWIFCIRFTYLLKYYREKAKKSDEEYEKILQKKKLPKESNERLESIKELKKEEELKSQDKLLKCEDKYNETKKENEDDNEKSSILKDEDTKKVELRKRR